MNRRDFPAERLVWEQAIGCAILAMGELEYSVLFALSLLENDTDGHLKLSLDGRLKKIESLLDSRNDAKAIRMRQLVTDVRRLAFDRNIIAHNPLHFEVSDKRGDDFVVMHPNGKRKLYLKDVKKLVEEARASNIGVFDALNGL